MSMNKKLLVAAIAGLVASANAGAIELGDPALVYASEIKNNVNITLPGTGTIDFALGYNFSAGEVRYGRFECDGDVNINAASVTESSPDISVGAVNGQGTDALFFSITAADPITDANGTSDDVISIDPATLTLLTKNNVECAFSIYDQPSQAQAGGLTGRIYTTGEETIITRSSGVVFSTSFGKAIADVSANPAYTDFVAGNGAFGTLTFQAKTGVLDIDGTQITLGDIYANTTDVVLTGDFSAAQAVSWGAAAQDVAPTDVSAKFDFDADQLADGETGTLTYIANGADEINESIFAATLDAVFNANFEGTDLNLPNVGEIERNGVELQAPLVQTTAGFVSRIALTNTGNVARSYAIRVINEAGNALAVDSTATTGTIPANGQKVIDLNSVITGFTTLPRGAVIVTVDAPDTTIQGLYQIVNPANGAISNETMVRPGTN